MAGNEKNLVLAIVLSALILLAWTFFVQAPRQREKLAQQEIEAQQLPTPGAQVAGDANVPLPEGAVPSGVVEGVIADRASVIEAGGRITLDAPQVTGSINLTGGRIDDLVLTQFRETVDPESKNVSLFSPEGTPNPYFAEFGWVDQQGVAYGSGETAWAGPSGAVLAPSRPVTLTWENDDGLALARVYEIDADFMFTITQRIANNGPSAITVFPFGRVTRVNTPDTLGFYILHEGPIGILDGTLTEVKYDDLRDDELVEQETVGGWIGVTDKYWLAALVPDQKAKMKTRFSYNNIGGADRYQADYLGEGITIQPGAAAEVTNRLFAGAKQVQVLARYRDELGIERFDMAIDFGWFFFLTKPFLWALTWLASHVGNFGVAILMLTVGVKAAFFPLANKSYKSMSRMKALQPQMTELREKFAEDKQKMQQELMGLYKREKVNPIAGCLPMVVQIPVFFSLYKVLFVSIEMRQAPFFGWIVDLSVPDPTTVFNLFGLLPFGGLAFFSLGAWPLIMGISMFLQQKLNPAPADPMQAKIFMMMPIIFTVMLANFPAGLVIYWAWNNTLSMAQQYVIMRRMGVAVGGGKTT